MTLRRLGIAIAALAFIYLIAIRLLPLEDRPSALGGSPAHGILTANGVPPTVDNGAVAGLPIAGTWSAGGARTGSAQTPWYPYRRDVVVWLASSALAHSRVSSAHVEVMCEASVAATLVLALPLPDNAWERRAVTLPPCSERGQFRFRVTTSGGDWIGVSAPTPAPAPWSLVRAWLAALGALALALVLVYAPGYALGRRMAAFRSPALVWLPGIGGLTGWGVVCWLVPPDVSPNVALFYAVCCTLIAATALLRDNDPRPIPPLAWAVFGFALISAARTLDPVGPPGELYRGTISRTFEIGDRSDSRIPYHVVQVVANHESPADARAHRLFAPWQLSTRGPLAGIAAAVPVLASGLQPPDDFPSTAWMPFDPEGFEMFRIAMIAFATALVTAMWGLAARISGIGAASNVLVLVAGAPFLVHEAVFTWPKLLAAAFVMTAAYLVFERRPLLAGTCVAAAYLSHPSALFALPVLAALVVLRDRPATARRRERLASIVREHALVAAGLACIVVPWAIAARTASSQRIFLSFLSMADGHAATSIADWVGSRTTSLANTLLPLWQPLTATNHWALHALWGITTPIDRVELGYWCTLPLALGLFSFPLLALRGIAAVRAQPRYALAMLSAFLVFWVYWGYASSGLLREGLHWWVAGLIVALACAPGDGTIARLRQLRWLRIGEVVAVLLVPSAVDAGQLPGVLTAVAIGIGAVALARSTTEPRTRQPA